MSPLFHNTCIKKLCCSCVTSNALTKNVHAHKYINNFVSFLLTSKCSNEEGICTQIHEPILSFLYRNSALKEKARVHKRIDIMCHSRSTTNALTIRVALVSQPMISNNASLMFHKSALTNWVILPTVVFLFHNECIHEL